MSSSEQDSFMSLIDDRIRKIVNEVFEDAGPRKEKGATAWDPEILRVSETQKRIMVKEFISIKEVAFLLGCSEGHVRNLVHKAQSGRTANPIPFLDLDGVTVFRRLNLLEWAAQPKGKLRAVS